jgi:flagella basal body P-ring formation protein FlgA
MIRFSATFLVLPALLAGIAPSRAPAQPAETPAAVSPAAEPSEALLADLSRQLSDHFHAAGELQLDSVRAWGLPSVPARVQARLVVTEFPASLAPSMLVRCRLETPGAVLPAWSISVHAQLWADIWTAREPLDAGRPFDPSALEAHRGDLLREHDALQATLNDRDYLYARAVPAGRVLVWRDLVRRPLVRKGETVEVTAVDGSLTVTVKALAIQNGGRGDLVLVRNLDSKKEFTAVVVDENRVQVRF